MWAGVVAGLLSMVAVFIVTLASTGPPSILVSRYAMLVTGTLCLVGGVAVVVGFWKLTTPDPEQHDTDRLINGRLVTRLSTLVTIALTLLSWRLNGNADGTLASFAYLSAVVTVVALLDHIERIARRIPAPRLARNTGTVAWGLGLSVGLPLTATIVLTTTRAMVGTGAPGYVGVTNRLLPQLSCVSSTGGLVFGGWLLVLVDHYRRALRVATRKSRHAHRTEIGSGQSES